MSGLQIDKQRQRHVSKYRKRISCNGENNSVEGTLHFRSGSGNVFILLKYVAPLLDNWHPTLRDSVVVSTARVDLYQTLDP
jgi:hypothetical protein